MLVYGQLEMAGAELVAALPVDPLECWESRIVNFAGQLFYFKSGVWEAIAVTSTGTLPPQTGEDNKLLSTNGTSTFWTADPTGHIGEFLTWDGTLHQWASPFPPQGGKVNNILISDGTSPFWGADPALATPGQFLQWTGALHVWADPPTGIPSMVGKNDWLLSSDGTIPIWTADPSLATPGQFLQWNGTGHVWADPPASLPAMAGHAGEFLRTDGLISLWDTVTRGDLNAGTPDWVVINAPVTGLMSQEQYLNQIRGGFGEDVSGFTGYVIGTAGDFSTVSSIPTDDIPDLPRALSTGIISGGVLSINATPSLFDLTAGTGEIIDYSVPTTPIKIPVSWSASTGVTVTNLGTAPITYILIDNLGALIQQTTFPTPAQQRDMIYIGRLNHSDNVSILYADSNGNNSQSIANQYADLLDALGPFNIQGNTPGLNGPGMTLSRTAGTMFSRYFNRTTFPKNPHGIPVPGQTPMQWSYRTRTGGVTGTVSAVDPANYDVAGVVTPIAPSSQAQIQRIYLFPAGETRIQYGQWLYANLAAALDALPSEVHEVAPSILGFGILIGYVVVQRNCTDLTEADRARVIPAARFDIGVGGGGSVSSTTLQQAYLNGFIPHITLTQTGGGLTVRDAATPITGTDLFRIQNNAGTTDYFNVSTDGIKITPRATAPTSPSVDPTNEGTMWYDTVDRTIRYYTNRPDSINIGQEINVVVRNVSGSPMVSGQVVRITGAVAGVPTVVLAQANSFNNAKTFAVITESIANNSNGFATITGRINQMNLSAFAHGDYLFLSATVAGGLTNVRPTAPNYTMPIGSVANNHSSLGILIVDFGSFRRIGLGLANQIRGVNATAVEEEYKTLAGTANRVTIAHSAGTVTWDIGSDIVTLTGSQSLSGKTLVTPIIEDTAIFTHETTPVVFPPAGSSKLYPKSDNKWYSQNSSGGESLLAGGLTPLLVSAAFTANSGFHYLTDTTAAAFSITLPPGSTGAILKFTDATEKWGTNNLTLIPATGEKIDMLAINETLVCDVIRGWVELNWTGTFWAFNSLASTQVSEASPTQSGIVNTAAQSFAGAKTFLGSLTPSGGIVGKTDGAAVGPGLVGEVRRVAWTATTIATSITQLGTTLLITKGLWLVRMGGVTDPGASTTRILYSWNTSLAFDGSAVGETLTDGTPILSTGASVYFMSRIINLVADTNYLAIAQATGIAANNCRGFLEAVRIA